MPEHHVTPGTPNIAACLILHNTVNHRIGLWSKDYRCSKGYQIDHTGIYTSADHCTSY